MKNSILLFFILNIFLTLTVEAQPWVDPNNDQTGEIYYNGGKVGIGQVDPKYQLDIKQGFDHAHRMLRLGTGTGSDMTFDVAAGSGLGNIAFGAEIMYQDAAGVLHEERLSGAAPRYVYTGGRGAALFNFHDGYAAIKAGNYISGTKGEKVSFWTTFEGDHLGAVRLSKNRLHIDSDAGFGFVNIASGVKLGNQPTHNTESIRNAYKKYVYNFSNKGSARLKLDKNEFVFYRSDKLDGVRNELVNYLESMRIDADGNVGIGTSAPTHQLTVNDSIKINNGGIIFPDGSIQNTAFNKDAPVVSGNINDLTLSDTNLLVVGDFDQQNDIPSSMTAVISGNTYMNGNLIFEAYEDLTGDGFKESVSDPFISMGLMNLQSHGIDGTTLVELESYPTIGMLGSGILYDNEINNYISHFAILLPDEENPSQIIRRNAFSFLNFDWDGKLQFYSGVKTAPYIPEESSEWLIGREEMDDQYQRFVITPDGKMGVGVSDPQGVFHFKDGNGELILEEDPEVNGIQFRTLHNANNNSGGMSFDASVVNFKGGVVFDDLVCVGTRQADQNYEGMKMVVKGNLLCEEVKVDDVEGADFVFEDDYQLRSLHEVESFITKNKHLPEIASAQEMKEKGIGLTEMSIDLLMKVEELTLYVIEQNKQLAKHKSTNEQLSKRLMELEEKLK